MAVGVRSRSAYDGRSSTNNLKDEVKVKVSFETDTTDATNVRGEGCSVNRDGVSEYTVQFAQAYPGMVAVTHGVENDSDALLNLNVSFGPYNSSAGTIKVYLIDPATGAAPAGEPDGPRINLNFTFNKYSTHVVSHTTLVTS